MENGGSARDSESDAALVAAVGRLARGVVRMSHLDYRDIAQEALLCVLRNDYATPEHREANAALKCRSAFINEVRQSADAASRSASATAEQLVAREERRPYVDPPFGLWPQEMRVYVREVVALGGPDLAIAISDRGEPGSAQRLARARGRLARALESGPRPPALSIEETAAARREKHRLATVHWRQRKSMPH
jgi:hypothetical protein